ncbi:heme exporter protein CcmD [Thalassotalea sp. G2M2-11]|uniref:heme exporter protein CcmD n=1 Tax=Thalassotalea sp. G2M2-11 TaxID=2787627 RepID=UPI0019D1E76F|nr:heme exporter protein CcmD [Thalassotalea sp. G2M2-11]
MQFSSLADFIAMGGHGFYVWLSYGVSAALLLGLVITSISNNKRIIKQIQQRQQREQKLKQAALNQQVMQQEQSLQEADS